MAKAEAEAKAKTDAEARTDADANAPTNAEARAERLPLLAEQRPAKRWADRDDENQKARKEKAVRRDGEREALLEVEEVRSSISTWRRSLAAAAREAGKAERNDEAVRTLLHRRPGTSPIEVVEFFRRCDEQSVQHGRPLSVHHLLGPHVTHLLRDLGQASRLWDLAEDAAGAGDWRAAAAHAERARSELKRSLCHALYLTFLGEARDAKVGRRCDLFAFTEGWGLRPKEVEEVWGWVKNDGLRFGDGRLPLALDAEQRCLYRKAHNIWLRLWTGAAPLWGAALALGSAAALFGLLAAAGIWSWPQKAPGWNLAVLLVFVVLGALLHLGSRLLSVDYDNPIRVYDAGGVLDWLSLRWLSVLQMYIPVTVVMATLWGAGKAPGSFQELGTAILAGYSADSLFRASADRIAAAASDRGAAASSEESATSGAGAAHGADKSA